MSEVERREHNGCCLLNCPNERGRAKGTQFFLMCRYSLNSSVYPANYLTRRVNVMYNPLLTQKDTNSFDAMNRIIFSPCAINLIPTPNTNHDYRPPVVTTLDCHV